MDPGNGTNGNLETSTTLAGGEHYYRQVCAPDDDPTRTVDLFVEGKVVIHCLGLFAPTRIVGVFHSGGSNPELTVYAGHSIRDSKTNSTKLNFLVHGEARKGGPYTQVLMSEASASGNEDGAYDGGKFSFYTTERGWIWSGDITDNGADAYLLGLPGKGGDVTML